MAQSKTEVYAPYIKVNKKLVRWRTATTRAGYKTDQSYTGARVGIENKETYEWGHHRVPTRVTRAVAFSVAFPVEKLKIPATTPARSRT